MNLTFKVLTAAVVSIGGLTITSLDADAQRLSNSPGAARAAPRAVVRSGPPPIVYRRPIPRYYYAAPLLAAPAIVYYSGGNRRYSCDELEAKCDRGGDWACRILERDPNC
jgi:hypothetical protein